jgi:hypothetical protein
MLIAKCYYYPNSFAVFDNNIKIKKELETAIGLLGKAVLDLFYCRGAVVAPLQDWGSSKLGGKTLKDKLHPPTKSVDDWCCPALR